MAQEIVEAAMMTRRQQESLYQGSYGWDWAFSDPSSRAGNLFGLYDEQPLAVGPTTRYDRDRGDQRPWLETEEQLAVYRMAGRTLCWQYEVAVGVLDCLANYTLGTGMQYSFDCKRMEAGPKRKGLESRIKDAWDEYSMRTNWVNQEREIHRRGKRDGEVFLLLAEDGLETIEPEWVTEPPEPTEVNERVKQDLDWKWGIATPKMHGYGGANPLAYFVSYPDGVMVAYAVGRMLHCKLNVDQRIKRGLTDFYPVYPAMVQADKITRNTGQGAAVQAAIAYIRENPAGVDKARAVQMVKGALEMELDRQTLDGVRVTDSSEYMPSGTVLTVANGQKYIPGPGSSNSPSYIQVTDAILRYAAIRWQMTDTMISGSSGSANYATALIKESPFVKAIEWEQVWWGNQYRRMTVAMSPIWLPRDIRQAVGGVNIAAVQRWFARNIQVTVTGAEAQVRNKAEESNRLAMLFDKGVIALDTWAEIEGFNPEQEREKQEREKGAKPPGAAADPGGPRQDSGQVAPPGQGDGTDLSPPAEAAAPYLDTAESAGRGLALSHSAAAEYLEAYRLANQPLNEPGNVQEHAQHDQSDHGNGRSGSTTEPGKLDTEPGDGKKKSDPAANVATTEVKAWAAKKFKDPAKAKAFTEWFGDSKVVDGDGKPLVVYHGTAGEFDEHKTGTKNAWSDSLGIDTFFHSENKETASTYANQFKNGKTQANLLSIQKPLVIDANGGEWHDAIGQASGAIHTYRTPQEKAFLDTKAEFAKKFAYELEYEPDAIPSHETKKIDDAVKAIDRHILDNKKLYATAQRQPYGHDGIIVKNVLDMTAANVTSETGSYNPFTTVYITFKPNQIKSATGNQGTFNPKSKKITESTNLPPSEREDA